MFKKKPGPERKPKGYLMMLDPPDAGPCSCRWEPLGFDPVSFAPAVVLLREGQSLPPVAAGHVRYCPKHGGSHE